MLSKYSHALFTHIHFSYEAFFTFIIVRKNNLYCIDILFFFMLDLYSVFFQTRFFYIIVFPVYFIGDLPILTLPLYCHFIKNALLIIKIDSLRITPYQG